MPAAIHHDPPCPTLNAHRVTDGLGRELWAVWCDHCDEWHWRGLLARLRLTDERRRRSLASRSFSYSPATRGLDSMNGGCRGGSEKNTIET